MSYICDICEKEKSVGRSQQHRRGVAGRRWKKRAQSTPRTFKPNLQRKTVVHKGEEVKMLLCAKCIKRIKNFGSVGSLKAVTFK